jgi:hypothetical protein
MTAKPPLMVSLRGIGAGGGVSHALAVPGPTTMGNSRRTDAPVGRTVVLQGGFRLASRRPGSKTVKGMGECRPTAPVGR